MAKTKKVPVATAATEQSGSDTISRRSTAGSILEPGVFVRVGLAHENEALAGKEFTVLGEFDDAANTCLLQARDSNEQVRVECSFLIYRLAPDANLHWVAIQQARAEHPAIQEESDLPFLNDSAPITSTDIEEAANAPSATTAPVYTPTKMKLVALADIIVTSNTRKVFDEVALGELAESIKAQGVIAPITVRPHGTEAGKFELVAGERRYRASKLAEQQTIPAVIRTLTDREFLEIQLLENLQRVDVRPADEASAFSKLLGSHLSAEEIAQRVGKPVKFVLQRAKLVALIPFWMELLEAERLPLVAAHELARLPAHSQVVVRKKVESGYSYQLKQAGPLEAHIVKQVISQEVLRELSTAAFPKEDASLFPEAGACWTCPKRSGANPGLFQEEDGSAPKRELCLDGACFAEKKRLFVQRQIIALTVDGQKPVLLSHTYEGDRKSGFANVYGWSKYSSCKATDKGAVQGLMVDGTEAGHVLWVKLKVDPATEQQNSKAEREATIRKNRIERQANELKADMLRQLFENQLVGSEKGGDGIHALLNYFIRRELEFGKSRTPNAMLDHLQAKYGWDKPTEADLNTTTGTPTWIDGDLNTAHRAYVMRQLANMPLVVNKLILYFDIKFRSGLEQSEVLAAQDTFVKRLPVSYQDEFNVTDKATKLVEARYYSKGKKQEATA